jgi:hypothetical protein
LVLRDRLELRLLVVAVVQGRQRAADRERRRVLLDEELGVEIVFEVVALVAFGGGEVQGIVQIVPETVFFGDVLLEVREVVAWQRADEAEFAHVLFFVLALGAQLREGICRGKGGG